MEKGYYCFEDGEKKWSLIRKTKNIQNEWFRIIHDSHEFLNVQGIPLVFFISINIKKMMKKYGDRVIDAMYMYSGEISQIICLLVTKYSMFCRPIKNIREQKLEEYLEIDYNKERITYAMLVGKENISQQILSMNLGEEDEK